MNRQGEQIEWLTNAFNELYEYVTNYLDDAFEEDLQQHIDDWFRENEPEIMQALDDLQEAVAQNTLDIAANADSIDNLETSTDDNFKRLMGAIQKASNYSLTENFRDEYAGRGNSVYALKFDFQTGSTENRVAGVYGGYTPFFTIWNMTGDAQIMGGGRTNVEITSGMSLFRWYSTLDTTTIHIIRYCILWKDPDTDNIHFGHLICGNSNNGEIGGFTFMPAFQNDTIPANTIFYVNSGQIDIRDWGSEVKFPYGSDYFNKVIENGKTATQLAIDWIHSVQNTLTYTNTRTTRFPYFDETLSGTDCSGLIANAYYRGISSKNNVLPNLANIQLGFGEIVQVVKPPATGYSDPALRKLDFSRMQAGDIVSYINAGDNYAHHSAIYDGEQLWHMNKRYAQDPVGTPAGQGSVLGPQPLCVDSESDGFTDPDNPHPLQATCFITTDLWGREWNEQTNNFKRNYAIVTRWKTHYSFATKNFYQNFAAFPNILNWTTNYNNLPIPDNTQF